MNLVSEIEHSARGPEKEEGEQRRPDRGFREERWLEEPAGGYLGCRRGERTKGGAEGSRAGGSHADKAAAAVLGSSSRLEGEGQYVMGDKY